MADRINRRAPSRRGVPTLDLNVLAVDAGVYCLVLALRRTRRITAGRLGCRRLVPGWYAYVGSAKRNLVARLIRHLRLRKPKHWHVDHLRAVASVKEIWIWPWARGAECLMNARVLGLPGASVPWKGFGSSDCGCTSHLTMFREEPAIGKLRQQTPSRCGNEASAGNAPGRFPQLTPASKGRILSPARKVSAAKEQP